MKAGTHVTANQQPDPDRRFRQLCLGMIVLLLAQFLLGMLTNLYVTIPASHPGAHATNFFTGVAAAIAWVIPTGPLVLSTHVVLGLALILGSLLHLHTAHRAGRRGWLITSIVGTLALIGAAFNGASFLNYAHDFSSMIMSGCFALAVLYYTLGAATTTT